MKIVSMTTKIGDHMKTDYGLKDTFTIFADLTEKVLLLPYDYGTKHDIKNLVCYIWCRKFKAEIN